MPFQRLTNFVDTNTHLLVLFIRVFISLVYIGNEISQIEHKAAPEHHIKWICGTVVLDVLLVVMRLLRMRSSYETWPVRGRVEGAIKFVVDVIEWIATWKILDTYETVKETKINYRSSDHINNLLITFFLTLAELIAFNIFMFVTRMVIRNEMDIHGQDPQIEGDGNREDQQDFNNIV